MKTARGFAPLALGGGLMCLSALLSRALPDGWTLPVGVPPLAAGAWVGGRGLAAVDAAMGDGE